MVNCKIDTYCKAFKLLFFKNAELAQQDRLTGLVKPNDYHVTTFSLNPWF